MRIAQDFDFRDLQKECWSGAIDTLKTIEEHDKEDALMDLLEIVFEEQEEIPTLTAVNDLLWFDDEWIFEMLGITEEEEDEDDA